MRLIDADALIAETMENRCADCDRRKGIKRGKITFVYDFGEAPCRACDVCDMIDTLDEAPTVGGWISVNDRMPGEWMTVLTFQPALSDGWGLIRTAVYIGTGKWREAERHELMELPVTHWMPLPEKPEEEDNVPDRC